MSAFLFLQISILQNVLFFFLASQLSFKKSESALLVKLLTSVFAYCPEWTGHAAQNKGRKAEHKTKKVKYTTNVSKQLSFI